MRYCILGVFLMAICTFSFAQERDTTWSLKGTIQISTNGYGAIGISDRREPFRYTASFRPMLVKNNWQIPIEVLLYNVGIGSNFKFMRFGVHPEWAWGKMHFGHTNLRLSNFSLSGKTLFGIGAELNPGLLRFAGFWGTTKQGSSSFLTNVNQTNAYTQNVYAFKLGLGTRNNFIDLILLKGKDLQNTVDSTKLSIDQYPEENMVVSMRTEHYLFKKKWFIGAEYAVSGMTWNQNSQDLLEEGELPILELFWNPKSSSTVSDAIEGFIGYRGKLFDTKFAYQRVAPGYRTFGAYFIQDDLESFDISLGARILKRKLRIKAKGGLMRNNLVNNRALQSIRGRGLLQVIYKPNTHWMIFVNYSNYQTEQRLKGYENQDSLKTGIISNNLTGSLQYLFKDKKNNRHSIRTSLGFFKSTNRQDYGIGVPASKNYNAALFYQLFIKKWQWLVGVDYLGFDQISPMQHRYGGKFELARTLNKNKWRLGVNLHQIYVYQGSVKSTTTFLPGATCTFRPNPSDFVQCSIQYSKQTIETNSGDDFSEIQGFIKYNHRFGRKK